jgi:glycogen synthase
MPVMGLLLLGVGCLKCFAWYDMRLLLISNIFPPGFIGGYELGAYDIACGLKAAGHEVCVVTSDFLADDKAELAILPVFRTLECVEPSRTRTSHDERLRRGTLINVRNIRAIATAIIENRPDRVLCYNIAGLGALGILRFLVGLGTTPLLHLMDDVFMLLRGADQERVSFEKVFGGPEFIKHVRFIVMSANLLEQVEQSLYFRIAEPAIVPGWTGQVDMDEIQHTVDETMTRFVFASRVAGHKGIDIAVEAARQLISFGRSDFILDVFGAGDVPQLLHRITALGLGEQVRYCGLLGKAELTKILPGYDALLFPTWEREAFGFIVSEAAAAGCIPIMTSGIGAAEWFFDCIDCIKIEREPHALASAMLRIMLMDPTSRNAMRSQTKNTGRRFFRMETTLARIDSILGNPEMCGPTSSGPEIRSVEAALTLLDDMWRTPRHG